MGRIHYRVRAIMFGEVVDLTDKIEHAKWWRGGEVRHALGTVFEGGEAVLRLINDDLRFAPYNPGPGIDPAPGPLVTIDMRTSPVGDWKRSFTGWSDGIRATITEDQKNIVEMRVLGPLKRIRDYWDDVFYRRSGVLRTDEVFRDLLDDIGWSQANRVIRRGQTRVFSHSISAIGVNEDGSQLVSFSNSADMLALAEGSPVYDDRFGNIVFESGTHRPNQFDVRPTANTFFHTIDREQNRPSRIRSGAVGDGVINVIAAQNSKFVSTGENVKIQFENDDDFPLTVTVGPLETQRIVLDAKVPPPGRQGVQQEFIQSWSPLVSGTHYTANPNLKISARTGWSRIEITVENTANTNQQFTLLRVDGNPVRKALSSVVADVSGHSRDRYGPRHVRFPGEVVVDLQELRARIDKALEVHDGITLDAEGNPVVDPIRRASITIEAGEDESTDRLLLNADISNLVRTTIPEIGLDRPVEFWVNGVMHEIDGFDEVHRVTLDLFEARGNLALTNNAPRVSVSVAKTQVVGNEKLAVLGQAIDPDPGHTGGLKFKWTTTNGGVFDDDTKAITSWTAPPTPDEPEGAISRLTLTATDALGATGSDFVDILVREGGDTGSPPVAAIVPATARMVGGETQTFRCVASDPNPEDILTYQWFALEGSFDTQLGDTVVYTAPSSSASDRNVTISCAVSDSINTVVATATVTIPGTTGGGSHTGPHTAHVFLSVGPRVNGEEIKTADVQTRRGVYIYTYYGETGSFPSITYRVLDDEGNVVLHTFGTMLPTLGRNQTSHQETIT